MRKSRLLLLIALVAALALAMLPVGPASAHKAAGTAALVGNATTSGTWAPVAVGCGSIPCPAANTWSFTSTTDVIAHAGAALTGSGRVKGSGTFTGWCGRSTGKGTVTVTGGGTHIFNITWTSAGTFLVLTDLGVTGTSPGRLVSIVNARASDSSGAQIACVTKAAKAFVVVGVSRSF